MKLPKWFTNLFGSKYETEVTKETPPTNLDAKYRARLVALVKRDIGLRETHGKNRSPLIDQINRGVNGAYIGGPYCIAALVWRGIMDLCKEEGLKMPAWMNTASTQAFYNNAPAKYRRPKGELPKKGDIGIQQSYSDPKKGHAYMLENDQVSTNQDTLEYNTDGSGGRDGDGFYERIRTQNGDVSKRYRGAVDVVRALIEYNDKD